MQSDANATRNLSQRADLFTQQIFELSRSYLHAPAAKIRRDAGMRAETDVELLGEPDTTFHAPPVSGVSAASDIGRGDPAHQGAASGKALALAEIAIQIKFEHFR